MEFTIDLCTTPFLYTYISYMIIDRAVYIAIYDETTIQNHTANKTPYRLYFT